MTAKEFIKSKQNDVLLNDYTLQDMIWFMTEFAKQEVSEQLLIQRVSKRFSTRSFIIGIGCGMTLGLMLAIIVINVC